MNQTNIDVNKVLSQYESDKNQYLEILKTLVRIPSVSFPEFDTKEVVRSAEAVAAVFREIGLENVKLIYAKNNPRPYVYADWLKKAGAPTLLLYAHHDVQPPGREEKWKTKPFEPTVVGDRMYGRGAADDKAGVVIHVAAIASWLKATGELPVNVKLVIEGEEEVGSFGLSDFLKENKDLVKADIMVLTDTDNYSTERPGLTIALRGIVGFDIEVASLKQSVHSGMWGGPIPDPAMALSKMLASLTDAEGNIAVPGIYDDVAKLSVSQQRQLKDLGENESEFRKQAGVLDGVQLLKAQGGFKEQIWFKPSLTINALEVGNRKAAANIILDSAWAKVTVRTVPNMDSKKVFESVKKHLADNCPFGLKLEIKEDSTGGWWKTDTNHPVFEAIISAMQQAWGQEPVLMGCGGSIPFVEPFSNALGGAPAILIGVEDPFTAAHSENESLHLGVFDKSIKSCIRFFGNASSLKLKK